MAIFDCFTFFNELDILEMRFDILGKCVDYFVLVESNKTHHGKDKPYYFYDNQKRYEKYKDKIIYVQVNDVPEYKGETDMGIVNFLRNCIMRGLTNTCRPDDYVIVSDVDEIPNPKILQNIENTQVSLYANRGSWKQKLRQHLRMISMFCKDFMRIYRKSSGFTVNTLLDYTPISLEYDLFYYFINCRCKEKWLGPYIAKYSHMMMPHDPRELSYQRQLPIIRNAGWHFSYLGGLDAIRAKLAALSDPDPEIEKKIKEAKECDAFIQKCLDEGIDILGRKGKEFEYEFISLEDVGLPNLEDIQKRFPKFFKE